MTLETMEDLPSSERSVEALSTNAQLRELVAQSGLQPAVAMTIFNRGLVASSPCTESLWKAYLAEPDSDRFVVLPETHLVHALAQFSLIGVRIEAA